MLKFILRAIVSEIIILIVFEIISPIVSWELVCFAKWILSYYFERFTTSKLLFSKWDFLYFYFCRCQALEEYYNADTLNEEINTQEFYVSIYQYIYK